MVGKDGACLAMAKTGECVAAVLNAPASVGSVTCAYADYIDPKNTWCAKATGVLKGKAPLPPREFCYNKAVTLPDLPSGWSVIMRPNMFPEVTYVRNGPGAGPVEVDASVGGVLPNDGQQITVSGNRYSYGLGVRASSEVKVTFRGKCYALVTDVGVDDEMKGMGGGEFVVRTQSLAETILANSTALRNGIFMRGGTEPFTMTVNNLHTLMGVRLQANRPSTYTVGNITMDHLDWADIRFLCGPDAPYLPKVQASVTFVKGGTGTAKRAKVGDIVAFSGSARDFNGSPISVDRFEWFINLVHCQGPLCHTHFVQQIPASAGLPSVASGQLTIDDHPLDGNQYFYFQIRFAATDVCGRRNYVDKNIIVDKV